MSIKKYLSLDGLTDYDTLIKTKITDGDSKSKSYTDEKISNMVGSDSVATQINTHNVSTSAHNDIRVLISDLTTKLNNFLDVDDTTSDQLSEVLTLIENNKGTLESLTTSKISVSDIVDNLTTAVASNVLSANQGVVIKGLIDALQYELDNHTHTIADVDGLQSALDGKAASSHGTHVTYSTTAPLMDGTTSVGSASTVARSDHKHPTDTSRASKSEFDSHDSNTTKHVTSTERSNWDAAKTHADSAHAPSNAEKNQNAFSNIIVGSTTISADTASDTLTLDGSNVTLTPTASSDKITIGVTGDNVISALGYTPWEFNANAMLRLYIWHKYTGDPTVYDTIDSTNYSITSKLDMSYNSYSKIIYADEMLFSGGKFSLVNATLMKSVTVSNMNALLGKYIITIPLSGTESTNQKSTTCIKIPTNATFSEESYTSGYLSYKRIVSSSATVYSAHYMLAYVTSESRNSYPDNGEHSDGYWYQYVKQLGEPEEWDLTIHVDTWDADKLNSLAGLPSDAISYDLDEAQTTAAKLAAKQPVKVRMIANYNSYSSGRFSILYPIQVTGNDYYIDSMFFTDFYTLRITIQRTNNGEPHSYCYTSTRSITTDYIE